MLFNSAIFLFVFLPLTMLGFGLAFRRLGLEAAWTWLAAASVFSQKTRHPNLNHGWRLRHSWG